MNSEKYIEFCNNNSGIYGLWIKSPLSGQNSLKVSVLNDMNLKKSVGQVVILLKYYYCLISRDFKDKNLRACITWGGGTSNPSSYLDNTSIWLLKSV